MINVNDLVAPIGVAPRTNQVASQTPKGRNGHTKPAVKESTDLARILKIPRRPPPQEGSLDGLALQELMTQRYRYHNDNCQCSKMGRDCIERLLFVQAWALYEMGSKAGLLGPIGVGQGKTIIDILSIFELDCQLALLLVPPNLVKQLVREYRLLSAN